MSRFLLAGAIGLFIGCGPSGPYLPCARRCVAAWDCPTGERQPACDEGLNLCLDDCAAMGGDQ